MNVKKLVEISQALDFQIEDFVDLELDQTTAEFMSIYFLDDEKLITFIINNITTPLVAEVFIKYLRKLDSGILEAHFKKFDLEKRPFLKRINEVYPVPLNKIFKLAPRETPVKKFTLADLEEEEVQPEPPKPISYVPSDFSDFG
jgi:hypothetical protein